MQATAGYGEGSPAANRATVRQVRSRTSSKAAFGIARSARDLVRMEASGDRTCFAGVLVSSTTEEGNDHERIAERADPRARSKAR